MIRKLRRIPSTGTDSWYFGYHLASGMCANAKSYATSANTLLGRMAVRRWKSMGQGETFRHPAVRWWQPPPWLEPMEKKAETDSYMVWRAWLMRLPVKDTTLVWPQICTSAEDGDPEPPFERCQAINPWVPSPKSYFFSLANPSGSGASELWGSVFPIPSGELPRSVRELTTSVPRLVGGYLSRAARAEVLGGFWRIIPTEVHGGPFSWKICQWWWMMILPSGYLTVCHGKIHHAINR